MLLFLFAPSLAGWFLIACDGFVFSTGFITIDGHDIRDLNPFWLRSHIGTVSQVMHLSVRCDSTLTHRSVKIL